MRLTTLRLRTSSLTALCAFVGICLLSSAALAACVSFTGAAYSENFDTLALSGTSSTTPAGWAFSETGTNANTAYTAGTGSSNTADTYSFGASANTERAFGGLRSGSLVPVIGACFTNNAGGPITSVTITYTGEQWRLGATGRQDRLDFQYSLDATSLTTGTWTDVNALDFNAPNSTGTVGALNGNSAANRVLVTSTIGSLSISISSGFWIRWTDFDASGADDGLGIDDLSLTATVAPVATSPATWSQVKVLYH